MPFLTKRHAGSDSYGHVWDAPESVVEVTDDEAAELLKIRDAHFDLVDAPADTGKGRKSAADK